MNEPLLTLISTVSAALSAAAAAWAIIAQKRAQGSKEVLDQAILSLERAHEALIEGSSAECKVVADRLNWLTCARHILSYYALKAKVVSKAHKVVCAEHEEYWRHHFYLLLNKPNITSSSYYAENIRLEKPPIEVKSALIVHGFASWPSDKPDPIDSVDLEHLLSKTNPLTGNVGLRIYISESNQYRHLLDPK